MIFPYPMNIKTKAMILNRMKKIKLYDHPGYKPKEKLNNKQASDLMYCQLVKESAPVSGIVVITKDRHQQSGRKRKIFSGEKVIWFVICKHRVPVIKTTIHRDMQAETVEIIDIALQRGDCIHVGETRTNIP